MVLELMPGFLSKGPGGITKIALFTNCPGIRRKPKKQV